MPRAPRGLVANRLVEVTTKTIQGRFLLRPSAETRAILIGVIARAQLQTDMAIVAVVAMSNHLHFLLLPTSVLQMKQFMQYVNSKVATKVGDLVSWKGKFWKRRYKDIVVWDDEADQVNRLLYILKHGTKENLVAKPADWPGLTVVGELCNGYDDVTGGIWHDRSNENEAKRLGKHVDHEDYMQRDLSFKLTPLPCWRHLSRAKRAKLVRDHVDEITKATRKRHLTNGTRPLGVNKILRQHPHDEPLDMKRTYAPRFHASSREGKEALWLEWRAFLEAYRWAVDALRAGLDACFPPGCFPPGLPYVAERPPP